MSIAKSLKTAFLAAVAGTAMTGCAVVPVGPAPVVYSQPCINPYTGYAQPCAPVIVAPVYRGWGWGHGWGHRHR